MAIEEIQISVDAIEYQRVKRDLKKYVQAKFAKHAQIHTVQILKKSLDARSRQIKYHLRLALFSGDSHPQKVSLPKNKPLNNSNTAHVIGFGPAGIFAAFKLIQLGVKPIVIERGKAVSIRRRDVAKLNRGEKLDPESNYCFGEGGAGTFSDGKLYTRSTKRGPTEEVLRNFVFHGADPNILYEAHPHIGTNKLPGIIERMRQTLIEQGADIRFSSQLTDLSVENDKIVSVSINGKEEDCEKLILATGHSARDIFELLHSKNILIEAKPFAMGFRLEHPQDLINDIQYHKHVHRAVLPPASYRVVEQVQGKGVFSFCMCPGGIIAPALTADGEVVVNGWSPSKRNGEFANSGWVTEINEEDWKSYQDKGPLAGLYFQKEIEKRAHELAGDPLKVPAQNLQDYITGSKSKELNQCSYHPGLVSVDLNNLYPKDINIRLKTGLQLAGKKLKNFISKDAIITAPESRTSSPVRIPRTEDLRHPEVQNLYPCGEGAGYAGGIVSAAIDGMRVALKLSEESD